MAKRVVYWVFINFAIVALLGVVLRLLVVTSIPALNYPFLLHAHSHFAFSGWMFLSLALLIIRNISSTKVDEYKLIFILTLIISFGMLISFSLQGYKATSIILSTLFILISYYFSYKLLREESLWESLHPVSYTLIKSSILFLCISSLGPFALGPIMAAGLKSTSLHNQAVYFYLHFQINGWMLLAALGLLFNSNRSKMQLENPAFKKWLYVFIFSLVPLYFMFTLWSSPSVPIRVIAASGAILNMISWIKMMQCLDIDYTKLPMAIKTAFIAVTLKMIFQVLVCIPSIGGWVFSNRNLIIGYIHLLTLGSITPLILQQFIYSNFIKNNTGYKKASRALIMVVIIYLGCLFVQPALSGFNIYIPHFEYLLLCISILFLLITVAFLLIIKPFNK